MEKFCVRQIELEDKQPPKEKVTTSSKCPEARKLRVWRKAASVFSSMSTPSAGEARDESSPQATCASLILPLKDATTEIALENKRNVSMRLLRKIYKNT